MILYLLFYYFISGDGLLWQKVNSMVVVLRVGMCARCHHFVTMFKHVLVAKRIGESLHDSDWNFNIHLDWPYFVNHLNDRLLDLFGLFDLNGSHNWLWNVDNFFHLFFNFFHSGNFCDFIVDVIFCSGNIGHLRNLADSVDLSDCWLKDLLVHEVLFGNLDGLGSSYDLGTTHNNGLLEGLLERLLGENRNTLLCQKCCLSTRADRFRCTIATGWDSWDKWWIDRFLGHLGSGDPLTLRHRLNIFFPLEFLCLYNLRNHANLLHPHIFGLFISLIFLVSLCPVRGHGLLDRSCLLDWSRHFIDGRLHHHLLCDNLGRPVNDVGNEMSPGNHHSFHDLPFGRFQVTLLAIDSFGNPLGFLDELWARINVTILMLVHSGIFAHGTYRLRLSAWASSSDATRFFADSIPQAGLVSLIVAAWTAAGKLAISLLCAWQNVILHVFNFLCKWVDSGGVAIRNGPSTVAHWPHTPWTLLLVCRAILAV